MARSSRFAGLRSTPRSLGQFPHARPMRMESLEDRRLLAALVGVDFGGGSSPPNWAQIATVGTTAFPTTRTNLIDETGAATAIDLTISNTGPGDAQSAVVSINAGTLPQHTPSIALVSNIVFVDSLDGIHRFDAKFSDLKPASIYEVYVFALEDAFDGFTDRQTVTISGGSTSIVFPQNPISANNLWVNDQVGSSAQPLENYRKLMTPTAAGHIDVTVQMLASSDALVLAGLAIREAGILVNNTGDVDDNNAANGVTTLREAIRLANTTAGADTILFAATMTGATIMLGGTELVITEALTIDAAPLAQNVTINANLQSRIFLITAASGDFTLAGLTLTGGRTTTNNNDGGAIRSLTSGMLTLTESTVSGNSTTGISADAGGISASTVTLTHSTVSGNSTAGTGAIGGGIFANTVTLTQSTVSGNSTAGEDADGGGIRASTVTLTHSTVSGNSTAGSNADGGGIFALSNVTLTQSTVSGNRVTGPGGLGGGIFQDDLGNNFPLSITGSIIAGNTAAGGAPDLRPDFQSVGVAGSVSYSLIGNTSGSGVTVATGTGNLLNVNPLLGPLADNGGPTNTHALLPGSQAIDVGNPAAAGGVDQRGAGFSRIVDGDGNGFPRIDVGAYEAQVKPSADFDSNTLVDGNDFLRWQRGLGTPSATRAQGNSDGDADTDHSDLAAWRVHFGATGVTSEAAAEGAANPSSAAAIHAATLDAVYAAGDFTSLFGERSEFRPLGKARVRRN